MAGNSVRVLAQSRPGICQADNLEEWEEGFFWTARRRRSRRSKIGKTEVLFDDDAANNAPQTPVATEPEFEQVKPLAEELLDTLVDLLFYSDFTLPKTPPGKPKVSYAIWQTGRMRGAPGNSSSREAANRVSERQAKPDVAKEKPDGRATRP